MKHTMHEQLLKFPFAASCKRNLSPIPNENTTLPFVYFVSFTFVQPLKSITKLKMHKLKKKTELVNEINNSWLQELRTHSSHGNNVTHVSSSDALQTI